MIKIDYLYTKAVSKCEKAQAIVEYALILSFVFIIALFMYYNIEINADGHSELKSFLLSIKNVIYRVSNMMKNAMSSM